MTSYLDDRTKSFGEFGNSAGKELRDYFTHAAELDLVKVRRRVVDLLNKDKEGNEVLRVALILGVKLD